MSFSQWLSCCLGVPARTLRRVARRTERREIPSPRWSFKPRLEGLEDRRVPSTLFVTRGDDNVRNPEGGTLRWAVDHAQNGDTILVIGDALRTGITLQDQLPLTQKGLTIEPGMNGNSSVNLPLKITESYGDNLLSVGFGAQVTLSNLFLTAVDGPSLVNSGILTLSGCTVSDNFVEDGIDNLQGATLTVNDSTVSDNSIGIYNEGTCTVSNSTVSDNGTGIFNGAGTLTVSGSTFYGNTSGGNIFGPYTDEGGNTFS